MSPHMKALISGLVFFLPAAAMAQESDWGFKPSLSGEISAETQGEWTYAADDDNERWRLGGEANAYLTLGLTERIALETSLMFEQVEDHEAGEDDFFENHGAYVEELKLTWTGEALSAFAGKYNPAFGIAWDRAPGIWGDEFAGDYEMTERLGAGGGARFGGGSWGMHAVTAGAFFADTSFLSDSLGKSRGNLDLSDGGASNTEDLSSLAVALDSEGMAGVQGLSTHAALRHQSEGDEDSAGENETGYALGASYSFPVQERYEVALTGEYAGFDNFDAVREDRTYLTLGGEVTIDGKWTAHTTWTGRETEINGAEDDSDDMMTFGGGYRFDNGIKLDGGYLYKQESDIDSHTVGTKLSYDFSF